MSVAALKEELRKANKAYRLTPNPIMSDSAFDAKLEELEEELDADEFNDFMELMRQDTIVGSKRKEKLPHVMSSLDKVKTQQALKDWFETKEIHPNANVVLTPKYDGLSLLVDESAHRAWTSGNGEVGQKSDDHLKAMQYGTFGKGLTYGEAIMPKRVFEKKYAEVFANARNCGAGQLNSDEPSKILKDMVYIRYAMPTSKASKVEQLDYCNTLNAIKVPYIVTKLANLTEDYLLDLYKKWSVDFEIDGIVVDLNDPPVRERLGRHSSTDNPQYAKAYKGKFEEVKEARVTGTTVKVSKQGYLVPVSVIEPTKLDGVTVTRASAYNFKQFVKMGSGKGAVVQIRRSGKVIPQIIGAVKRVEVEIPKVCPSCNEPVDWNETETHLECVNPDCPAQQLQRIIAFFVIMKVEEVGRGTLEQLYNEGYDTVEKILKMKQSDFRRLEGFGDRSAEIAYTNIHAKMKNVNLSQLMHASGCFRSLGSRKLALVEHLWDQNPTVGELNSIRGFSNISSAAFIKGISKFKEFLKGLPVTIKTEKDTPKAPTSSECKGMVFVFTGFRSPELEAKIKDCGGEIAGGVNKKTTHLVMKEKGSGSGKEQKAQELGIKIWNRADLEKFLG